VPPWPPPAPEKGGGLRRRRERGRSCMGERRRREMEGRVRRGRGGPEREML